MYHFSHLYTVKNKDRNTRADDHYNLMQTQQSSYLFTDEDLNKAERRASANENDLIPLEKFHSCKQCINPKVFFAGGIVLGMVLASVILVTVYQFM